MFSFCTSFLVVFKKPKTKKSGKPYDFTTGKPTVVSPSFPRNRGYDFWPCLCAPSGFGDPNQGGVIQGRTDVI